MRKLAQKVVTEIRVYRSAMCDPRTPRLARWMLGLAVGYVLMPFDIIPDFIPGLGQLDDIVIVGFLTRAAIKRIPPEVMDECRAKVTAQAPRSITAR